MEVGQSLRPTFPGTVEGFNTVELKRSHELRTIGLYGRDRRKSSEPQLPWEVSLWENMFPGVSPPEVPLRRDPTFLMIHERILESDEEDNQEGWDEQLAAFLQHLGTQALGSQQECQDLDAAPAIFNQATPEAALLLAPRPPTPQVLS